jgi:acyl-CoA synthetase (AMP-forming)/AMP-acid ligase II
MGMLSFGVSTPGEAPTSCGILVPWVQAEAVTGDGEILPLGVEGILRFRSEDMATSYLNDPLASAEQFKDGWFYPGDLGIVSHRRTLSVTGRSTERINAGGMKTSPGLIEDVVGSYDGIKECAVFGVPDHMGVEQICAAVVAGPQVDIENLRDYCASKLGVRAPRRFVRLAKLPRNENGKILRGDLAGLASGVASNEAASNERV